MAVELKKLRGLSPDDLDKEERGLREEIWKLRLQRSTGQLQDVGKIRRCRQNLARLMTVRRELAVAKSAGN